MTIRDDDGGCGECVCRHSDPDPFTDEEMRNRW